MESLARTLTIGGVLLVGFGILLYVAPSLPLLGKLPGDIRIERPGSRLYVPITTCLVISAGISAALWLFSRTR